MSNADNQILKKMLERLFASLINGPSLNCRPHASRQRLDLIQLGKLGHISAEQILRALLGADRQAKVLAKIPMPRQGTTDSTTEDDELTAEQNAARAAYREQQAVITKLRGITEDARTYENDTGVHVLQIGFPVLHLPAGSTGQGAKRRILAPLAFVSLSVAVKSGATPAVTLECRNEGADLVVPNSALLAWLEQQTGQRIGDLFSDESGEKPWSEIVGITKRVCELMQVTLPDVFAGEDIPEDFALVAAPRSEDDEAGKAMVVPAAVVGLYPMANQGLLRDMQALAGGEPTSGPIESFIKLDAGLEAAAPEAHDPAELAKRTRRFAEERFVTVADPCQARAVQLARSSRGLVVHGPPGTGKSQTITNIIGDHLARGERVLFVCDKRTALDVVMNRLDGMGLGSLCAIVHDPQRDQRELYKSIREQLDGLVDLKTDASADGNLSKADAELQRLHGELTDYHAALMRRPDKDTLSFHELMGRWLEVPNFAAPFDADSLRSASRQLIDDHAQTLSDLCDRAAKVGYVSNPWKSFAGLSLEEYLTTPVDQLRSEAAAAVNAAEATDAALDPAIPPIPPAADLSAIAQSRTRVADEIENIRNTIPLALRTQWAHAEPKKIEQSSKLLADAAGDLSTIESTSLDRDFAAIVGTNLPTFAHIAEQTAALNAYLDSIKQALGFLAFGKKSAAAKVLAKFALQRTPENAVRLLEFLTAIKARLLMRETFAQLNADIAKPLPDDDFIRATAAAYQTLFAFLQALHTDGNLSDIRGVILSALVAPTDPTDLLRGLRATAARVELLRQLEAALSTKLFAANARQKAIEASRSGQPLTATLRPLVERFDSLENVLRVDEAIHMLPEALKSAASELAHQNVTGETALAILRKAADANELLRRLKTNRVLMTADDQKLQSSFTRYQQFDATKKQLTRDSIRHYWTSRQKARLVAGTGGRLNSVATGVRLRLTMRGERAMRLRQVIAVGQAIDGGDPLYDLRPVWMASPETVAQLFPRAPLFDVVIFDEASQCRLEEALPVLLRAKRVVIAGDPKQLPPTRFFESAVAVSEEDDIETDQQLFEHRQGEIEDLLAASLNTEIDECYLDVHYRSRNADLMTFSNEQFYHSRLQTIPGHPHNRTRYAPLSLYKVNGTYEKRSNVIEAEKVCQIVRDLLKRAKPPSVGIACFNTTQRDLIVEKLEELATADAEFGRSYAAARERRSASSFEGLFVKNLENVQGDERDHMIISTTYGPDPKGKFYRRFGPVGSAGGGRRLNVLVTRAREEVHLVTSIPETVYRNLPPVPAGETPGGAWLLFAYLVYAEQLAEVYEQNHRLLEQVEAHEEPVINVRTNRFPSNFSRQLAKQLHGRHRIGSDVHWGNDGFCVDLALHHPDRADDVTVGVLCDMNRFEQAADPVEWEVFRTTVLQQQGWTFSRVWTPHFVRDPKSAIAGIVKDAEAAAKNMDEPDAIRTMPT